tara:strand:- start:83 stop:388 length:306 start_codon:yes stop_codon:yes gene_type:complete
MAKSKSKKSSFDIPEIPFTYDFYLVYWEDIQSDSGWKEMKDIQRMKPAICVSTGWLVKADKNVHILMSDYNYDDNWELADGGNTTVIPTKNVIKKFVIKDL